MQKGQLIHQLAPETGLSPPAMLGLSASETMAGFYNCAKESNSSYLAFMASALTHRAISPAPGSRFLRHSARFFLMVISRCRGGHVTQTVTKQVLILRKCHQGNGNDFFSSSHGASESGYSRLSQRAGGFSRESALPPSYLTTHGRDCIWHLSCLPASGSGQ